MKKSELTSKLDEIVGEIDSLADDIKKLEDCKVFDLNDTIKILVNQANRIYRKFEELPSEDNDIDIEIDKDDKE